MISQKLIKLKKYLFLISVLLLSVSFFHLVFLYLYEDSLTVPVKGGTISEGLIGNFPSLNPLKTLSGNNKYVINLLYRSLLKYDLDEKKIIGDIANCDLSSLINIECYINENAKWSNGEPITTNDIYATYNIIKTKNLNTNLSSLLNDTKIEYKDNIITFKNNPQDINFLNIFFQPIVAKSVLDNLTKEEMEENFPIRNGLYSGNFKIPSTNSVDSDSAIGVTKLYLEKNENYSTGNISRVVLNIFPNINTFLKNKQSVNIFNDNENVVGDSISRLQSYKYTLPRFVGLFINQNKVSDIDLRTFIFDKINPNNLIELLGKSNFDVIVNPYLTKQEITRPLENRNFESIMNSLGYLKKSSLIQNFLASINLGNVVENTEEEGEKVSIDDFQEDSKYIISPKYIEKYNFVEADDILLEGNVDNGVSEVWINDYKLTGFTAGNDKFFYRLKENYNSIKEGENNYKIYFIKNGEKELKEEIVVLYYKNQKQLEEEKLKFIIKLQEEKKASQEQRDTDTSLIEFNQKELEKLNKLDENTYYNKDLTPFTLRLYYLNSDRYYEATANFIKNSLKELGIEVDLFSFDLVGRIKILEAKDDYDMILEGVDLGYFGSNIFPYFHSSQAKNGFKLNFSNIKSASLDLLLEELKSNILSGTKIEELKNKVLEILKKEQVVKTLYTPKINLLLDKNLKIEKIYEEFPNKVMRAYILDSSYIKDDRIINYKSKSISSFFKFILKKLYE